MVATRSSSSAGRTVAARVTSRSILVVLGLAAVAASASPGAAQSESPPARRWDVLVVSGTVVPTGSQRDALKRANINAAQLFYAVRPKVHLNATLGWGRSRDLLTDGAPKLDLFTYDLGVEVRTFNGLLGGGYAGRAFLGGGVGARTYDYRGLPAEATHNLAAYAGGGAEFGRGRVRVRLEVRDYVTGFRPLDGGPGSELRNDVAVIGGLRIGRR